MYESDENGAECCGQPEPEQMDLRDKLSDESREESDARIEESTAEKEAARREADRAETKYGSLIESDGAGE